MTKNEAFLHLGDALPADIARRRDMGDLEGAVRLIDQRLSGGKQPLLAPRLEAERVRLERLGHDYPFTRAEAVGQIRAEWPEFTEEQFDALVDGGRIDWRMLGGEMHIHERFLESLRIYPREAPGLRPEQADHTERDAMLARMEREGSLTARITLRASIRALVPVAGGAGLAAPPGGLPPAERDPDPGRHPRRHPRPGGRPPAHHLVGYQGRVGVQRHLPLPPPGGVCGPPDPPPGPGAAHLRSGGAAAPHSLYPLPAGPGRPADGGARLPGGAGQGHLRLCHRHGGLPLSARLPPAGLHPGSVRQDPAGGLRGVRPALHHPVPHRGHPRPVAERHGAGPHDWAMFYLAPHGWLWADCSFGSSARRSGEDARRAHYFGSLDPWRMVANSAFQAPLTPPMTGWRQDPYDNQVGELMVDGRGLDSTQRDWSQEVLELELL